MNNALGFAHAHKRRNVTDLYEVILACNPCHDIIEKLPEHEMSKIVRDVIKRRLKQPVVSC